jgi:hypothetical protein
VADADYADIRAMLSAVSRAGLLPEWWWPRWQALTGEPDDPPAEVA